MTVTRGAGLGFTLVVLVNHALNLFELIPGDITLMSAWDQSQPLVSRFPPADMMRSDSLVAYEMFCLAVAVGSSVNRRSQHTCMER